MAKPDRRNSGARMLLMEEIMTASENTPNRIRNMPRRPPDGMAEYELGLLGRESGAGQQGDDLEAGDVVFQSRGAHENDGDLDDEQDDGHVRDE